MNKKAAGMERSSNDGINMKGINLNKLKDSWVHVAHHHHHHHHQTGDNNNNNGDLLAGFSWPPRSYTCSFCRREFRSAQALGGHMNVHRRDRARLRQSPPPTPKDHGQFSSLLNLNLEPPINPNPNPSYPSSPSRKFPSFLPTLPPSSSSAEVMGKWSKIEGIPVNDHHLMTNKVIRGYKSDVVKKNIGEIAKLELKIGLKEDLDLELRLGYT